jgi:hypothetical protein
VVAVGGGLAQADPAGPQFTYDRFQSPSGNIACMITDGGSSIRCDILQYTFAPPPPPNGGCGPTGYGHTVSMATGSPARFTCAGDTVADPSLPVLPYGANTVIGGAKCYSGTDALSCSVGEHHLRLSRDSYDLE